MNSSKEFYSRRFRNAIFSQVIFPGFRNCAVTFLGCMTARMKPGLINKTEELVENGHQLAVASSTECAARERSLTELGVLERNCPQEGLLIW